MDILDKNSLANTLDLINGDLFLGKPLSKSQKLAAAKWIAGRQGLPGSYAGMFAPTEKDFKSGIRFFTGEQVRSGAATAHILGEEAMRTLIVLDVHSTEIDGKIRLAREGMLARLGKTTGFYCCGICTCSLWRNLAAGGLDNGRKRLSAGMQEIKSLRKGDGTWKRFPFYYTILALSELGGLSRQELEYAAPRCEKLLKRLSGNDKYTSRRRTIIEKSLEML